jgi:hypothetical protein
MSDISSILIDDRTGLVSFGWPSYGPVKLEGIFSLVQLACYTILRTSGADMFRPDYGTTFLRLTGTATINDLQRLYADIAIIIKSAEKEIFDEQAGKSIRPDDKLTALTLIRIDQDPSDPTIFYIHVRVRNDNDNTLTFGIPSIRA